MTLTPAQIAEWRMKFERTEWESELKKNPDGSYTNNYIEGVWQGYLRARTEQATEITEQKAKLAEVMPLAKYAAWHLTLTVIEPEDVNALDQDVYNKVIDAVLFEQDEKLKYQPNIEATIETLLKE